MRSLAQPKVLAGAGLAALITSLACYPRLALWSASPAPLLFSWLMLLWVTFMLWSFVLGWHLKYTGQRVLAFQWQARLWMLATLGGVVSALVLRFAVDPYWRVLSPTSFPSDWRSWLAMSLFSLAFDPLFLCFAPYAFFMRLFRRQTSALVLTVSFELFVLYAKLSSSTLPTTGWLVEVIVLRVVAGFLSVYCYVKGGIWLIWWLVLVMELRHLLPNP
ncbi:MAG: hypothetical protein JWR69_691 [Pedosphaera sp.]|nr:hypothetical protein [Pedosphaera sp.]